MDEKNVEKVSTLCVILFVLEASYSNHYDTTH